MRRKTTPTLRIVPDELWRVVRPILVGDYSPRLRAGRPRCDTRLVLDAILYRLRSGCPWKMLPSSFPSGSTCHTWHQRWSEQGLYHGIWANLAERADARGLVRWLIQCVDGGMNKAERGGDKTGPNPTDRGKLGTKRSILVDQEGGPLAIVVDGANRHDQRLLKETLKAVVIPRPATIQHLCLDKGYTGQPCRMITVRAGYIPHIRQIGEAKRSSEHPPRRWVVERTLAWFNRYRALKIRYERKSCNYEGALAFAAALMWWRRLEAAKGN